MPPLIYVSIYSFIWIIASLNNLEIFRNFQITYVALNLMGYNSQAAIF